MRLPPLARGPAHGFVLVGAGVLLALAGRPRMASVEATTSADRSAEPATVSPLFDLTAEERSPFPSDRFTVADDDQITGRRVTLALPADCETSASECEDRALLNQLDGFNLQARLSVPFSGAIDPSSAQRDTVFLLNLGGALARRERLCRDSRNTPGELALPSNAAVGINNVVWDPATRELSFRPDVSLEQHTTYALVVTTGVRDARGIAIQPAQGFRRFRQALAGDRDPYYRCALEAADRAVRHVPGRHREIAALSVFTTQSATHVIERMRAAIQAAPAPTIDFKVGPGGSRAVFAFAQAESFTQNAQTGAGGTLTSTVLNAVNNLRVVPGAVGTVAFGVFRTLDFTTHPSGHVAPIPTRTGALRPTGTVDVAVDVVLPAGTRPAGGWPVAILAHGGNTNKNFAFPTSAVLNSHGIAVISINNMGHGGGPLTTTTVRFTNGTSVTYATPGLGYDADDDGEITAFEPYAATRPYALFASTGPIVQTVAQYFALIRTIHTGVDVDGDGTPDLDPSRIYMFGHSMGGAYTIVTSALEPAVRAAVSCAPEGTFVYHILISAAYRSIVGERLAARVPSLVNSADGLASFDGRPVGKPLFNDNLPLRNQPPRINTVPGAIAIQRVLDHEAWASQTGNAVAFAPLLRRSPPAGTTLRPFLVQMARSDPATANPTAAEIVRAGDFADRLVLYRHDLNFGNEGVPPNAHLYLNSVAQAPNWARIGIGAQQQIATFFETDGKTVIHPTPEEFWEVPIRGPLPDDTYYLPRPK